MFLFLTKSPNLDFLGWFFGKLTRHLLITPIHLGASNGDLRNKNNFKFFTVCWFDVKGRSAGNPCLVLITDSKRCSCTSSSSRNGPVWLQPKLQSKLEWDHQIAQEIKKWVSQLLKCLTHGIHWQIGSQKSNANLLTRIVESNGQLIILSSYLYIPLSSCR